MSRGRHLFGNVHCFFRLTPLIPQVLQRQLSIRPKIQEISVRFGSVRQEYLTSGTEIDKLVSFT